MYSMFPDLFFVPLMFHIGIGHSILNRPIFMDFQTFRSRKFSVAPLSRSATSRVTPCTFLKASFILTAFTLLMYMVSVSSASWFPLSRSGFKNPVHPLSLQAISRVPHHLGSFLNPKISRIHRMGVPRECSRHLALVPWFLLCLFCGP